MGAPRVTVEVVERRLNDVHGDVLTFDKSTFTRVDRPCCFVDRDHGAWWALPSNVFAGHEHPKRGYSRVSAAVKDKRGLSAGELQRRLDTLELGLTFKVETLIGSAKKCCFVDPIHGEWWSTPSNVIHKRSRHPIRAAINRKKTLIVRYGVDNPTKNAQIALRAAVGTNSVSQLNHWKTDEELLCVGSYELAVVRWLNAHQHGYEWQPGPFMMPDGRTYRPDALILDGQFTGCYIEIKGYFRDDAKEKWGWFHSEHPDNSQLWMKKELQDIGILPKKRTKLKAA
jgi:hypothetical protein